MGDSHAILVENVASVFRGILIEKIDFQFHPEGLVVNPLRLRAVGEAISKGRIEVVVGSTGKMLSAAYSPHSNKMTLANEKVTGTATGRSGILHEGVHALVDLYKCTSLTDLSDEAAAYLAETIFLHTGNVRINGDVDAMRIYNAADDIAKQYGLYKKKGVKLTRKQYEPLRQAIHVNPAYIGIGMEQMTSGHGIP